MECKECGSMAINHDMHGRDGSDENLCDVCYWRLRFELRDKETWMAAVDSTDKIFKETVKNAMDKLSDHNFMVWIRGFVS